MNEKLLGVFEMTKEKLECGVDVAFGPSRVFIEKGKWVRCYGDDMNSPRPRKWVDCRGIESKQIEGVK